MKYDFHGYKLEQALNKAHQIIGEVRMRKSAVAFVDVEFIVGHGVIRNELISLLKSYGIEAKPQLGNAGVILCHIE